MNRDVTPADGPSAGNARRRDLLAAAAALRAWTHARSATWRDASISLDEGATIPPLPASIRSANATVAEKPLPPPVVKVGEPAPPPPPAPELVAPGWATLPPSRFEPVQVKVIRQVLLVAPVRARWSRRLGIAAALVVALVSGAWAARTFRERLVALGETLVRKSDLFASPVALDKPALSRTAGRLQVDSSPAGSQVIIDGRARGVTPLTIDNLRIGVHNVVLTGAEGELRRTVTVSAGSTASVSEAIYPGWVQVFSPFDLEVWEGGRAIRLDDRNQALVAPGSHRLRFANTTLGYHEERLVEVRPGDITAVSVVLPPSTITVTATRRSDVSIDGTHVGETPLVDQPIPLGTREVVVSSGAGDSRRFSVTVGVKPVRLDVDFSHPSPR